MIRVRAHPRSARAPVASMVITGGAPRSTSMTARSSCPWRHQRHFGERCVGEHSGLGDVGAAQDPLGDHRTHR